MRKKLAIILLSCSSSLLCQETDISKSIDTLKQMYKQNKMLVDSMENQLESLANRDDSIYNVIINGNCYQQPITSDTFCYMQIIIEYQEFIKNYGGILNPNDSLTKFPIKNVKKETIIGFGNKLHPIYKTEKAHLGIDIPAPEGEIIKSTISGKVLSIKESNRGDGNQVIIQNDRNIKVIYSHLDKIEVNLGKKIKSGETIGTVGSSGLSVANHLHYEILINDVPINPIFVLFNEFIKEDLEYIFNKNCMSLD